MFGLRVKGKCLKKREKNVAVVWKCKHRLYFIVNFLTSCVSHLAILLDRYFVIWGICISFALYLIGIVKNIEYIGMFSQNSPTTFIWRKIAQGCAQVHVRGKGQPIYNWLCNEKPESWRKYYEYQSQSRQRDGAKLPFNDSRNKILTKMVYHSKKQGREKNRTYDKPAEWFHHEMVVYIRRLEEKLVK